MDQYFVKGFVDLLLLVVFPAVLYICGIKSRHGMSIIVSMGSLYTIGTAFSGHVMCALIYSFFIAAYIVYRADKYVDEMKANKFTYEEFKNYVDMDFSDIEQMFTNIFGESEQINTQNRYSKEFNKYFYSNQYNEHYSSRRFNGNDNSYKSKNNDEYKRKNEQEDSKSAGNYHSSNQQNEEINVEAVSNGLRYYAKCMTVEDAKKAYRKYAVTFHPDNPVTGDENKFIEIDKQYNRFVEIFGGR